MLYRTRRFQRFSKEISKQNFQDFVYCLDPWIPFPDDCDKNRRNRIFNFRLIFQLFLHQVFEKDCSCSKAVSKAIVYLAAMNQKIPSSNTASFCNARKNISSQTILQILQSLSGLSQEQNFKELLWQGRSVKVIDTTNCDLPDTLENQKAYPQPSSQKPGCGFPKMNLLAVFSLSLGTIVDFRKGHCKLSEKALFRSAMDSFQKNDIILGDRAFDAYADFHFLSRRKVNFVIRAKEKNRKNIKVIKKLGKNDHLVQLQKPSRPSIGIDKETWKSLPEYTILRRIKYNIDIKGFRSNQVTILTDLVNHKLYTASSLKELYYRRWRAELCFRDIKEIMGMDVLSCKTPDMVEKELYMYIIAYNLIRNIMNLAALKNVEDPERISFKRSLDFFREILPFIAMNIHDQAQLTNLLEIMYDNIATMKNPNRPYRREPRAKKRRPKRYQLLTKPRSVFREIPHRGKKMYSLSL